MWWISAALAAPTAAVDLHYVTVVNDPWVHRRGLRGSLSVEAAAPLEVGLDLLYAPPWSTADWTPLLSDVVSRAARVPNLSRVIAQAAPTAQLVVRHSGDEQRGSELGVHGSLGVSLVDIPAIEPTTLAVIPEQTTRAWHVTGGLGVRAGAWRGDWGLQVRVDAQLYRVMYAEQPALEAPIWLGVGLSHRLGGPREQ